MCELSIPDEVACVYTSEEDVESDQEGAVGCVDHVPREARKDQHVTEEDCRHPNACVWEVVGKNAHPERHATTRTWEERVAVLVVLEREARHTHHKHTNQEDDREKPA